MEQRADDRGTLLDAVRGVSSDKEFFKKAHNTLIERTAVYNKGFDWGRRLTIYEAAKPEKRSGERRQIVDAVGSAVNRLAENRTSVRKTHKVDTTTGRLVAMAESPSVDSE